MGCTVKCSAGRRCRRRGRRKDSAEREEGALVGVGWGVGRVATIGSLAGDSGAEAQGLTEGPEQPSACTNQML